jgi:hypothetical protein
MANTVTVQTIDDGPRNLILHLFLESDGVAGEVVNQKIAEGHRFAIQKVWSSLSGFDVVLSFDSLTDVPAWVCTPESKPQDFLPIGGIPDPGGLDSQKNVLLSTKGFTSTDDRGSMVIHLRKKS